jgi:hypothetical protein
MSILTLGIKQKLVNNAADVPARVTGTGQDAVLTIEGFGSFPVKDLVGPIKAVRGVEGNKGKLVIEPADITIAANTVAGTLVNVVIELDSAATIMEFARHDPDYGKKKRIPLKLSANETATTFLRKLHAAIDAEFQEDGFDLFTSTETDNGGALDYLTLETREDSLNFKRVTFVDGHTGEESTVVTAFAPEKTTAGEGVNNYGVLKLVRLATEVTTEPHTLQSLEQPIKGALYSSILFSKTTERSDLGGSSVVDQQVASKQSFQLFIREASENTAYRSLILDTLLSKTGITAVYYGKDGAVAANKTAFLA